MDKSEVFMYLSVVEGLMIVCMLGWEIFWLRRMYLVLWAMPTAKQISEMISMIKDDRDAIAGSLKSLVGAFDPLKNMFSSFGAGFGGLGNLFSSTKSDNSQEH